MEQQYEEQKLWDSFRAGSEEAFVRLFQLYSDPLFYYGCSLNTDRALIKDGIQELLCNLWERRSSLPPVQNLRFFLFGALRRILLRKLQRESRQVDSQNSEKIITDFFNETTLSPESHLIRLEEQEQSANQLQQAIQSLPDRQREAIHLRYFQGLSYAEMAEVMEVKKGTIGRFIVQAIDTLRQKVKKSHFLALLILYVWQLLG